MDCIHTDTLATQRDAVRCALSVSWAHVAVGDWGRAMNYVIKEIRIGIPDPGEPIKRRRPARYGQFVLHFSHCDRCLPRDICAEGGRLWARVHGCTRCCWPYRPCQGD